MSFPAAIRWEAPLKALLVAVLFLGGAPKASAFQGTAAPPGTVTRPTSQPNNQTQPSNPTQPNNSAPGNAGRAKADDGPDFRDLLDPQKSEVAKPQKGRQTWRVRITSIAGTPFISVYAKKAPLVSVAAELQRQLKIPILLAPSLKQKLVTLDFVDFNLEAAAQLLAPHVIVDYIVTGGDGPLPSKREAVAIYIMGEGEKPPKEGPWIANKSGSIMVVGMVYETEEEERAALEKKEKELQIIYSNPLFNITVHKRYLTEVLDEIADAARIPFTILTRDGQQKELDQVVEDWNIRNADLEEITRTWFPNGVRLYWRTDLESFVSKPLRLTIEPIQQAQQAEQNVTH